MWLSLRAIDLDIKGTTVIRDYLKKHGIIGIFPMFKNKNTALKYGYTENELMEMEHKPVKLHDKTK